MLTWTCSSRHNGVHFFRHRNFQKWSEAGVLCTFWFGNVLRATAACTFFDIANFQSGPNVKCFYIFYLQMCFAPQRRAALFRHANFQKWSEYAVFCPFCLGHVLRGTTACTFSTSQFPKVVRTWGVLINFLVTNVLRATTACNGSSLIWPAGSAPAALARLLFDPPEPQTIWKTQWIAYLFAHLHLLACHSFSSLIFSLLDFSSLTLLTSAFPSLHIVGSLTSKLPSISVADQIWSELRTNFNIGMLA